MSLNSVCARAIVTLPVPWTEHVITAGPDVMFTIADLDGDSSTVEVLSAQFFTSQLSLQVLDGSSGALVSNTVIDNTIGPVESVTVVDINGDGACPARGVVAGSWFAVVDVGYAAAAAAAAGVGARRR